MRNLVILFIVSLLIPLGTFSRKVSPHSIVVPDYYGYQGILIKDTTRLDEWKWYHQGDWVVGGAAHGTTAGGFDYTDLMFVRYSDDNQVIYNFRVMQYVGPDNNWDWPPDGEFLFSWNTRKS